MKKILALLIIGLCAAPILAQVNDTDTDEAMKAPNGAVRAMVSPATTPTLTAPTPTTTPTTAPTLIGGTGGMLSCPDIMSEIQRLISMARDNGCFRMAGRVTTGTDTTGMVGTGRGAFLGTTGATDTTGTTGA